jgi:hypothetical protein
MDQEKLLLGGMPQSLKDRFGDAVNDLIQPRGAVAEVVELEGGVISGLSNEP